MGKKQRPQSGVSDVGEDDAVSVSDVLSAAFGHQLPGLQKRSRFAQNLLTDSFLSNLAAGIDGFLSIAGYCIYHRHHHKHGTLATSSWWDMFTSISEDTNFRIKPQ